MIGYWAWEAPDVPDEWRNSFLFVNEVWVPSHFVATALRRAGCRVPVRVVPHPLRIPVVSDKPEPTRHGLQVLVVLAFDSGFQRKNPLAAIAAFRAAFATPGEATLIIKTRGHSRSGKPEAALRAAVADSPNIQMIHGDFSPAEYTRLLADTDVLLSLHRAEGFGLPCAEMMLLGKPVIATAWSGNLDFMTEDAACLVPARPIRLADPETDAYRGLQSVWAEPDVAQATAWLHRLRDPVLRSKIGHAARNWAVACLGREAFAAAVMPSLGEAVGPRLRRKLGGHE